MIAPLLRTLELKTPPEPAELERHFRRLIKRYHPDCNPSDPDWATSKSRAIIEAYQKLKEALAKNGTPNTWQNESRFSTHVSYVYPFQKTKADSGVSQAPRYMSFQLLRFRILCALPIKSILEVGKLREFRDRWERQEAQRPDSLFALQASGNVEEVSLSRLEEASDRDYLFWLYPEESGRALLVGADWRFEKLIRLDLRSTPILPCTDTELFGIRLYHKNESFFCPSELVFQEFLRPASEAAVAP